MTSHSEEELAEYEDAAVRYYLGLWNLLIKEGTPRGVIINSSINNMLATLDQYMNGDQKVELLKEILKLAIEEADLETEITH
jgi:hypothetical protein